MITRPIQNPIRVLMVEDDPGDVRLTREALSNNQMYVILHDVPDGIEAMAFLRQQGPYAEMSRPDLILLDLDMPRMNGREVLAELKDDTTLSRIPVIVMTNSQSQEDILAAYDMNASCFITKPVGWKNFLKTVKMIKAFWLTVVKLPME